VKKICIKTRIAVFGLMITSFSGSLFADTTIAAGQAAVDSVNATSALDKVVVTATRSARTLSESPASVVVITRREIQESAAKNIDDVLQYAAGVQVKRVVGMGEGVPSDIVLRGIPGALAATRTLILVDGIPTNVAGTPFLIVNEVPLDAIQRVEIVKGPFSSLYGANALGGIINIITIQGSGKPTVTLTGETSFPFTAVANFTDTNDSKNGSETWSESFDESYWNGVVQANGRAGRCDFLVSAGMRTIGNYYNSDSAFVRNVNSAGHDTTYHKSGKNHGYTDYRIFVKSGYSFTDATRLSLNLRYFNSSLGFGLISNADSATRVTSGTKILVGPYLQFKPFGRVDAQIGGFFRNVKGEYLDQYPVKNDSGTINMLSKFDVVSTDYQLEGRASLDIMRINHLTLGFDQLWNSIDFGATSDRTTGEPFPGCTGVEKTLSNTGVYVQDEIAVLSMLCIVPALRLDYHSTYGADLSPKLSAVGTVLDKLTLRVSAGKAFRAPSTTELYMPNMYFSPVYLRPNPDLQPETVLSYDCGLRYELPAGFTVTSDYFYNDLHDLVVLGDLNFLTNTVTHKNVSDAWSWGIESETAWKKYRWVGAKVNYAFTKSENETYKAPLDYIPEHKGNLQLDLNWFYTDGVLGLFVDEGFVGERQGPDWKSKSTIVFNNNSVEIRPRYVKLQPYWRTDCTVNCTFASRYTVSVAIQNLFNAQFEESPGTLSPSRLAVLKVKAVF